jgi:hypothetical protein
MFGIGRPGRKEEEWRDSLNPIGQMDEFTVRFAPSVRLASEIVESEEKERAACMARHPSAQARRRAAA